MISGPRNIADGGGTVNTGSARDIIHGYTPEQHEAALEKRLTEFERLIREAHAGELSRLEEQAAEVRRRLKDVEADFKRTEADLAEARKLLNQYDNHLEREKVDAARRALDLSLIHI